MTSVRITAFDGSTQTVKPQQNVYTAKLSSAPTAVDFEGSDAPAGLKLG